MVHLDPVRISERHLMVNRRTLVMPDQLLDGAVQGG
jgi:hypothetical protein